MKLQMKDKLLSDSIVYKNTNECFTIVFSSLVLKCQKTLRLGQLRKPCNFLVVCVFRYARTQNRAQTSICKTRKREKGIKPKQTFHILAEIYHDKS